MSCESSCYEAQVNSCDDIKVNAGLPASTAFYVMLSKNGGKKAYQKQYSSNGSGEFTILKADFPAGLFNPYAGFLKITLRKASDYTPQLMTFGAAQYGCVLFEIKHINTAVGDTSPINVIQ